MHPCPAGGVEGALGGLFKARLLDGFRAKGFDHLERGHRLLDPGGELAVRLPGSPKPRAHAGGHGPCDQEHHDVARDHEQAEPRLQGQECQQGQNGEDHPGKRLDHHGHQAGHHRTILVGAVDGVPNGCTGMEAHGHGLHLLDHLHAQRLVDALLQPDPPEVEEQSQGCEGGGRSQHEDHHPHAQDLTRFHRERFDVHEDGRVEAEQARLVRSQRFAQQHSVVGEVVEDQRDRHHDHQQSERQGSEQEQVAAGLLEIRQRAPHQAHQAAKRHGHCACGPCAIFAPVVHRSLTLLGTDVWLRTNRCGKEWAPHHIIRHVARKRRRMQPVRAAHRPRVRTPTGKG